jgi:type II secretory pathway component PulL
MKVDRIKADWASLRLVSQERVIVCVRCDSSLSCTLFDVQQLLEAIKSKQISVNNWAVSIPHDHCITKTIELPAVDIDEAFKMLEFELPSHVPISPEDFVYGCTAIKPVNNLLRVLVQILKIDTLDNILEPYKTMGIKPGEICVDSVAVKNWFNQDRNNEGTEIDLLFTQESCLVLVGTGGNLEKLEAIQFPDYDITNIKKQVEEEINHLTQEIIGIDPKKITLKIVTEPTFIQHIQSWFNNDFGNVEILQFPEVNFCNGNTDSQTNDLHYDLVITEGLLRTAENPQLGHSNFLPQKVIKKAERRKLVTNFAITAIILVAFVSLLWLNFVVMNWRISRACDKIESQIIPIEHVATSVESKRQRVKAIQKQLSNRGQIGQIFAELYQHTPKHISVSELKFSSKNDSMNINIRGQADSLANAFEYSDNMNDSGLLNNIQIIDAQQIPKPGGSIVEFKANCVVRSK